MGRYNSKFRCKCQGYWERKETPLYVRVMTQSQDRGWGTQRPATKAKHKWERIGTICLKCRTVELYPEPAFVEGGWEGGQDGQDGATAVEVGQGTGNGV